MATCDTCKRTARTWRGICKDCRNALVPTPEEIALLKERQRQYAKKWRDTHPDRARAAVRRYHKEHQEALKNNTDRRAYRQQYQKRWNATNPEKLREYSRRYRETHPNRAADVERWKRVRLSASPEKRLQNAIRAARQRARRSGLVFEEELFDILCRNIPTTCLCCNDTLDYTYISRTHLERFHANIPSLDRIINTEGYTVKNTAVICARCNHLKGEASLDDLKKIATYVERELLARGLMCPLPPLEEP